MAGPLPRCCCAPSTIVGISPSLTLIPPNGELEEEAAAFGRSDWHPQLGLTLSSPSSPTGIPENEALPRLRATLLP